MYIIKANCILSKLGFKSLAFSVVKLDRALPAPLADEIMTMEEHIKGTEVSKNSNMIKFDYMLNDKASKSKILKAAKRVPFEVEVNSTSQNLIFSAGTWFHAVLPSIRYFEEVKGDKTCKIGEYSVKIGGVRVGKESNGKHVNSQIIFFAHRDKLFAISITQHNSFL